MYIFSPRMLIVAVFTLSYFSIFTVWAVHIQNYEFMLYEVQMAILMGLFLFMDKRVQFSKFVLWALALWGFGHLAGGLVPIPDSIADMKDAAEDAKQQVLYNMRIFDNLPRYDQMIHAFGFGTCAVIAKEALQAHIGKQLKINWPIGSIVFLVALGLGSINEVIEFTLVMTIPDTNVGGYINTGWDLVSNTVGALIAVIAMRIANY